MSDNYNSEKMDSSELQATIGLSTLFAFRMLGMFMVLPVMSIYGKDLLGATPILIGFAIAAYGYTQAILQIPLGMLSDRIGRFPIILVGLLVFILGSVVAALSTSIWGVILGRILQGMGAISAAIMALLSDLTREQHRTKAMAFIGMSIGCSFAIAMITGPIITAHFGLQGLFWFIALMALLGIFITLFIIPKPKQQLIRRDSSVNKNSLLPTLKNPDLLKLDFSIAAVHAVMMANFIAIPQVLIHASLPKEQHWWVYLTAFLLSFIGMVPLIIYGEKKRQLKRVLIGSIATLLACSVLFTLISHSIWLLLFAITVFFIAFNIIEATLPSLVSKVAKPDVKGTAMGIFSSSQFLGAAIGASLGGILLSYQPAIVFIGTGIICFVWLIVLKSMKEPPYVTCIRLILADSALTNQNLMQHLLVQEGISDAVVIKEESAIYIKIDKKIITPIQVEALITEASSS